MMRQGILSVLTMSLMLGASALAARTVAYVNYPLVLKKAPQAKASMTLLDKEFSDQRARIKSDQSNLLVLRKRFLSLGPETNSLERANVTDNLKKARKKLNDDQQDYETAFSLRRDQLAASLHKLVRKEIQSYAQAHGFSAVLGSQAVFAAPAVDITDAILERLNADYKVAQEQDRKKP